MTIIDALLVTALVAAAATYIARRSWRTVCRLSGGSAPAPRPRRVTLTLGGKPVR